MMWAVLGLLLLIAAILIFIALRVDHGIAQIQETIIATSAAERNLQAQLLVTQHHIEKHTAASARVHYEAEFRRDPYLD
jgi:hypothetical protein